MEFLLLESVMISRRSFCLAPATLAALAALPVRTQAQVPASAPTWAGRLAPLFISDNRPLVMVRSAGGPPAPMVFDTGTSGNALDTPYARLIEAPRTGEAEVIDGATGHALAGAYDTVLGDVSIGGVAVGDQTFGVYPRHAFNEAGIVGPNAFGDSLVAMDLTRGRLYVRPRSADAFPPGEGYPYMEREGGFLPGISVHLPGLTVQGIMDSGNDADLALPPELIDRLPLEAPPIEVGRAVSVSGSSAVYEARIVGDVRVGSVTLQRPTVHFRGKVPNVGFGVLKKMLVVMDPTARRSWVLEAGPPRSPLADYAGRYGSVSVGTEEGQLYYQRDGRSRRLLRPWGDDLFEMSDPDSQVQFIRSAGTIVGLELIGRRLMSLARN